LDKFVLDKPKIGKFPCKKCDKFLNRKSDAHFNRKSDAHFLNRKKKIEKKYALFKSKKKKKKTLYRFR